MAFSFIDEGAGSTIDKLVAANTSIPSFDPSILKCFARSNALLDSQLGVLFRESIESMETRGRDVLDAADVRFMMRHWDSGGSSRRC